MNYPWAVMIRLLGLLMSFSLLLAGCTSKSSQSINYTSNNSILSSPSTNTPSVNKTSMAINDSKISSELMDILDTLGDADEIDVLVYPSGVIGEELKNFLSQRQREGTLNFNILELANCIAVKGQKQTILEIANRDDVSRITANPRFTTTQ